MAFEFTFTARDGHLHACPDGPVTGPNLIHLGQEIRKACEAHTLFCVLIDCSGMTGALGVVELFETTQKFIRIVGLETKVAYIHPPASWKPEDDRFSRTVAQNRGGSLELFEDESAALVWFGLT